MNPITIEMTATELSVLLNHIRFTTLQVSAKRQIVLDRARAKLIAARRGLHRINAVVQMRLEELGALVEAANHTYPMGTSRTKTIFERVRNNLRIELAQAREDEE